MPEQRAYTTSDPAVLSLQGTLVAMAKDIARLRELLEEYGRHAEDCNAQFGDQYRSRCGWREVEAQLREPEAHYA